MDKTQDLTQLRDIHLPDPIAGWPLAPGWYLLALLIILTALLLGFFLRWIYLNGRAKRHALRLLTSYQQQYQRDGNSQLACARISELLKRVALTYFPRQRVASLQGEPWIIFLNDTAKNIDFLSVKRELLEFPYDPQPRDNNLSLLFDAAKNWIKQRRGKCLN